MKLWTLKKFKSRLLLGLLSASFFIGGCSSDLKSIEALDKVPQEQSKVEDTYTDSDVLSYDELKVALKNGNIPNYVLKAKVERVIDGDTVKLNFDDGTIESLRILLIDTPEDTKEKQYLGDVATDFAKSNLKEGDTVYVETDGAKTDKYGRYLGYLWYDSTGNKDYKMYNEEVVKKGLARVGYIYDAVRHLDKMKEAQYEAQKNKQNIWAIDGYVTDKGFDQSLAPSKNSTNINNSSNDNTNVVYANSSSKKYHISSDAHGMKNAIKMNKIEAESLGYSACKTCYK